MSLHTMQDLLVTQLRELHASERRSDEVLPRLADGAADRELARFFQRHAEDARERARRLERVLDRIGAPAADGTVSGSTGVNRLTGAVGAVGLGSETLGFTRLGTTRRAGPPRAMELERRFLQALEMTDRMWREGATLVLARGDRELARLIPEG